ncbi:GNAT family N-acetyltransferase [Hoeflea sp.]|nr:GNAT family N-acetyltransferase [Hoeflea sp.]MBU4546872.1 GNAT family N-acetyltransferase [Alphaproteobacteria bacterium]MBU4551616.1 GNAT family N-acetyltransferase [Alphaproteobacteria bacterium]MBV1759669.1 GNAT family N-acetyltransferase [Hoeflea sp.]
MNSAALKPSASTRVRRAVAADLPSCAAIINDYMDATTWLPRVVTREAIGEMYAPPLLDKRIILVAEDRDDVVGYLSMDHAAGFIHAIYLRPHARSTGLGKALLDAAKEARPQGFELTVFEPNTNAMRFYIREGLLEVPGGRNDDTPEGVPTLLMRWPGAMA